MIMTANERNNLLSSLRDMHKDAFGFRGSNDYSLLSDSELLAEYEWLLEQVNFAIDIEKIERLNATKAWKTLMRKYMQDFSISLATAIRWDVEAMGFTPDEIEFYKYGLYVHHYGMSHKWERFLNRIMR